MNGEYNCKVLSKKILKWLLKNLQNTTEDYFFCCTLYMHSLITYGAARVYYSGTIESMDCNVSVSFQKFYSTVKGLHIVTARL